MELYWDLCACDCVSLIVKLCMWNAEAKFFSNTQILPWLFEA